MRIGSVGFGSRQRFDSQLPVAGLFPFPPQPGLFIFFRVVRLRLFPRSLLARVCAGRNQCLQVVLADHTCRCRKGEAEARPALQFNRISPIIWLTLWGMALLSMAVMGYQAGLTGTRSSFATWTLAATFAFVIVLITDLDRPRMTLFEMKQDLLVALRERMDGQDPWEGNVRSRE